MSRRSEPGLRVLLHGEHVADLRQTRRGLTLTYREEITSSLGVGALCLSVALPVATRAYQGDLVLNFCEGLLPEGEMRTTLERVIVVERYDRRVTAHGVTRVHQEDGCQALGVEPSGPNRYQSQLSTAPSFARLAQVLVDRAHIGVVVAGGRADRGQLVQAGEVLGGQRPRRRRGSPPGGPGADSTDAQVSDFARRDQGLHRAVRLLDGRLRVDPELAVHVSAGSAVVLSRRVTPWQVSGCWSGHAKESSSCWNPVSNDFRYDASDGRAPGSVW